MRGSNQGPYSKKEITTNIYAGDYFVLSKMSVRNRSLHIYAYHAHTPGKIIANEIYCGEIKEYIIEQNEDIIDFMADYIKNIVMIYMI